MNKLAKKLLVAATFVLALTSAISLTGKTVFADNGTGGGGGTSINDTARWWSLEGEPGTSTAWNKFTARVGAVSYIKMTQYAGMSDSDIQACQLSAFIWYAGDWDYWYTQGNGTNTWSYATSMPKYNEMVQWMNTLPYGKRWNDGHRTLVCSGSNPAAETTTKTTYNNGVEKRDVNSYTHIVGVHDSSVILSPEKNAEFNTYSATNQSTWNNTHNVQTSDPVVNKWGEWYDRLVQNGISGIDINQLNTQDQLNALANQSMSLQQGDYVAHPKITMNAANRKGFARGGVFTVTEQHRDIDFQIFIHQDQQRNYTQKCTTTTTGSNSTTTCDPKQYSNWTVKEGNLGTAEGSSLIPYSYWQMINVRCNSLGLNTIASKIPGFVKDSYGSGTGSSSGHTPTYINANNDLSQRPLGNPANNDSTLANTGHDSFYEQSSSCDGSNPIPPNWALNCSSTKRPNVSNDSKNNIVDGGTATKNDGQPTWGANLTGTIRTTDQFSFYRDNAAHGIRTDLWYPVVKDPDSGVSANADGPASGTRILFYKSGTPAGSNFGLRLTRDGSDILTGDDIANDKGYVSSDELTTFYPHGSWVSDENSPEKMNIDWAWKPTVTNNVLTVVSGNGAGANPTKSTDKSGIVATCAIRMNNPSNMNVNDNLKVYNKLFDTPLESLNKFDGQQDHYVTIRFVRATADAQ